jgi:aspartyl-tRNA(Asn)/glutamyl-tRNA(Gln) amidotransferase subunit B
MSVWTTDELLDYDEVMERYDPVLGLEVHVELSTASKMFCGCSTDSDAEPNTHVCPVCLGLPGSLPAINGHAVESAIRIGLALNCEIAPWCRMARKNYFYPDMTKDYQISQYDEPICHDGHVDLEVDGKSYRVEIERAHMEEDAGKSLHVGGSDGRIQGAAYSLMDYNRAGVPLIEIVTKPVRGLGARAPQVARAYMAHLRDIMIALGVSHARMEKGNLRCDANVSLMPKGSDELGTRTETKNVNSLRSVEGALTYEIQRQGAVLASGGRVRQETRMWQESGEYTIAGAREVRRRGLPLLPRTRPGAGRVLPRVGRGAARHPAGAARRQAGPAGRRVVILDHRDGRRHQCRGAGPAGADRRRRCRPRGGPKVVAHRAVPAGQRGRLRSVRGRHDAGPGGRGAEAGG